MTEQADIVVCGAGHNSLIAAAYLAKAGFEVLVLEAKSIVGGNTVTEELSLPGFRHDTCSSAHVIIQTNPMLRTDELELGRYGLNYVYPDPAVVLPFGDDSITMWRDTDATAEELARFSAPDAGAYVDLLAEWDVLRGVHARVSNNTPEEPLGDSEAVEAYGKIAARSAWDVVHERFTHPQVRAFMLWMAGLTTQPVTRPGTGILVSSVTAGRAGFGWATPIGGSGALPAALVALIEEHGGRVVTDARVEQILVEGGSARAVVTADGRRFDARRAVLSTIHVARLPGMIRGAALPAAFTERVAQWDPGLTLFAVHLALAESPRYRLRQGPTPAVAAGFGTPAGTRAQLEAFDRGEPYEADPWLLAVCSSLVDDSRAPDGQATVKLLTMAPYELAEGPEHWDARKDAYADVLVRRFAEHVEGFEAGDELARVAESPLDLERHSLHNWRGSCHGGALTADQAGANRPAPGWAGYRLPIPGLYQTGATTHPGGSVSGRPGRNAARVLLADLGVDPGALMSGS
jgi:phytoene dehydrogenase-like protein